MGKLLAAHTLASEQADETLAEKVSSLYAPSLYVSHSSCVSLRGCAVGIRAHALETVAASGALSTNVWALGVTKPSNVKCLRVNPNRVYLSVIVSP